jgi:NitT/TauT family transport system permease protein
MCKLYGLSDRTILKQVQIPQILPPMLVSAGTGPSLSLKLMVAAEVISATSRSIGALLNNARQTAEVAQMIAIVVVTVVLGLIIEGIFSILSKKVGKWK